MSPDNASPAQATTTPALTWPGTLSHFAVPQERFVATHLQPRHAGDHTIAALCVNAIIFHPSSSSSSPRILLLRRALSDTMPGLWEPPGGGLESTDSTILHGAAREALEESGLVVARAACVVGRPIVYNVKSRYRSGPLTGQVVWYGKLDFVCELAEKEDDDMVVVRLDPAEHEDYAWASEEEVRAERMADGRAMHVTYKEQNDRLLEAFRMKREGLIPAREDGEGEWVDVEDDDDNNIVAVLDGVREATTQVDDTGDVDLEKLRDPSIGAAAA